MFIKRILIIFLFIIYSALISSAQEFAIVSGYVRDKIGNPIDFVNVAIFGTPTGTSTNQNGYYELKIPANKNVHLVFSCVGFKPREKKLVLKGGERFELNQFLEIFIQQFEDVNVEGKRERSTTLQRLDPKLAIQIPGMSGNIEAMLKTLPGVSSNNELSSQYTVRGGNFDENLVYVNDIEVYRPILVRSGQQEGLSFVNPDMVSSILFSAGGFDAKYGDKMSSVLDIRYRKPTVFASTLTLSMLGGSAHIEGVSKNRNFTHISGVRYQTTQYVLNSLDVQGDYKPSFTDFQTFWTYDISDRIELNFLGNFAQNKYWFVPQSRETTFGTINEALKLKIYFDGQELDQFQTFTGAVSANYRPREKLSLKFIASAYQTKETETFDIQGQYYLNELDRQMGSNSLGDSIMNIGVGTFLNHARNYLNAFVVSASHLGTLARNDDKLQWGLTAQREMINSKIHEWEMIDSAGYSIPYSDSLVLLYMLDTADFNINSNRISSYVQNTRTFSLDSSEMMLTFGLRGVYWDFN